MLQRLGTQITKSFAADFASKTPGKTMSSVGYEKLFRNVVDIPHIDEMIEKNIALGKKTNIAFIGLGESGIEPLTYLTQIYLTARKSGKTLNDVLGKVDFIDIQKAYEVKHTRELLDEIEKGGFSKLKHLFSGLAPKEKDEIYNKFQQILKESDSKYLGHFLDDFVDNALNHKKYDLTFCNNVFYYVGQGNTPKYRYAQPGSLPPILEYKGCYDRYFEVMKNLLSTLNKDGKLFFHHDVGKEINNQITKDLKSLVSKLNDYKEVDLNIISKTN